MHIKLLIAAIMASTFALSSLSASAASDKKSTPGWQEKRLERQAALDVQRSTVMLASANSNAPDFPPGQSGGIKAQGCENGQGHQEGNPGHENGQGHENHQGYGLGHCDKASPN